MRAGNIQPPLGTQLLRSHPMSQGLIGCWLLNGAGGNTAFDSVGLGNGILTNGTTRAVKQKGQCCIFDKSNDEIRIPLNTRYQISNMTFSALFYCTTDVTSTQTIFMIPRTTGSNTCGFGVFVGYPTASKIGFLCEGSPSQSLGANTALIINTWYRVTCTRNSVTQQVQLFLNGLSDSSLTSINNAVFSSPEIGPNIGYFDDNSFTTGCFGGYIQDVFLWNRVLSASGIINHHTSPYQMFVGNKNSNFAPYFETGGAGII